MDDFSWLASQNGFQFDPQIFGDYREPQESVLGTVGGDDTFFNDAFPVDFTTPYNVALSPVATKKDKPDLMAQIDAAKNGDDEAVGPDGQLLTCNTIWEKLQNCARVQSGDFDLDGLCSELQTKAKCSGSGPVVNESDFKHAMKKYLGKTDQEMADCEILKNPPAVPASS
jgi:AP-1-like factor